MDPNQLRQYKREQRRKLTPSQQARHAEQVAELVLQQSFFINPEKIAIYLANDSEIDPVHIVKHAWEKNKKVFLPVLSEHEDSLLFAPFEPDSKMSRNQYGIDEPNCSPDHRLTAEHMDLILLPLVAFDEQGNRMGMGGGFYDRSLANIRQQNNKTCLVGLAHEVQKTEHLEPQSWDIPLDAIVTEDDIYLPHPGKV